MLRKRRQGGYLLVKNPDGEGGRDREADTFTCRHCNRVTLLPPGADPASIGRWCSTCDGLLCPKCSANLGCAHVEKRMALIESRARLVAAL